MGNGFGSLRICYLFRVLHWRNREIGFFPAEEREYIPPVVNASQVHHGLSQRNDAKVDIVIDYSLRIIKWPSHDFTNRVDHATTTKGTIEDIV